MVRRTNVVPPRAASRRPLLIGGVVLLVAIAAIGVGWYTLRDSGRSEKQVVADYIEKLNARDVSGMRHDISPGGESDAKTLIGAAQLPWKVDSISIAHDFGPDYATAVLTGTQNGESLNTTLTLISKSGKWYVGVGDTVKQPISGSSSTSSTQTSTP